MSLEICPKCNKNEYDPWFYKEQGKPQEFPFKSCWDCRKLAKEAREQKEGGQSTFSGGSGEIVILLREIRDLLKGGTVKTIKEKTVGEPPKEKEIDVDDIPVIEDDPSGIDVKDIPF